MKSLIFDSGPLISLTMNNLLWLIKPLRKLFKGEFLIPESVKSEIVDKPFETKRFKFEALQVQEYLSDKTLKVLPDRSHRKEATELLNLANSCFTSNGKPLSIVHYAEISCLIAASRRASALVMDERVTREFVENPQRILVLMQKKLHATIRMNRTAIKDFAEKTAGIKIIRSAELAAVAFEKGMLNRYESPAAGLGSKTVLESVLWGLKLDGCAINESGIKAIMTTATG